MDVNKASLDMHYELAGKIEVVSRKKIETRDDLSLAYTPGVAEPCRVIAKDYEQSFKLTRRSNLVAVITDGTAVLGLGDIGPAAGMPVMEGKCVLFKEFADVDAFPPLHRLQGHGHHCPDHPSDLQELRRNQPGGHCGPQML